MLLNPFLQLGKLRQRPLWLEPVVPCDSAAEFVPAHEEPNQVPLTPGQACDRSWGGIQEFVLTFALTHRGCQLMEGTRT